MTAQPIQHQTERLLEQIRTRVAELGRHRANPCRPPRAAAMRRAMTRLRWLITQQPGGGNPAA